MSEFFGDEFFDDLPDWAKDDEEGDDGNGISTAFQLGAQHVMLLLDCHSDMFAKSDENGGKSPMDLSLHITQQLFKETIKQTVTLKTGKRNGIGLIFYNTKLHKKEKGDDSDSDSDDEMTGTVREFIELSPPGIEQVQRVRSCIEKEGFDLEETYGCFDKEYNPRTAPLQSALDHCRRCFANSKCVKEPKNINEPFDSKSIWIFTNRSDPYPRVSRQIQTAASDAKEQGIQIIVWPLFSSSTWFDSSIFFRDLCSEPPPTKVLRSLEDMEDRLEDLRSCWKRVRRSYHGPMILSDVREQEDAPAIWVDWFRLVQYNKKPTIVKIDRRKKIETIQVKNYIDHTGKIFGTFKTGNTDEPRNKTISQPGMQRIRQFADFRGEKIPFSQKDMDELRHQANGRLDNYNLVWLGFKPIDSIPFHHIMDTPYFLYPNLESNDADMKQQNTEAFCNLHAAMLRNEVLAIGESLIRTYWQSKMVAIIPIQEVADEDGFQRRPPGFLVVSLPFEDDIRDLEIDEAMKELNLQETRNEDLVMKQEFIKTEEEGDPLPNHVPSMLGGTIEDETDDVVAGNVASEGLVNAAIGLVQKQILDERELGEDFDNADLEKFFNYVEAIALQDLFFKEEGNYDTEVSDNIILQAVEEEIKEFKKWLPEDFEKAKAAGRKRKIVEDTSGLDWEYLYMNDELKSCKVDELKKYLRSKGEGISGKKADLMFRVTNLIQKELEKKGGVSVKMEGE